MFQSFNYSIWRIGSGPLQVSGMKLVQQGTVSTHHNRKMKIPRIAKVLPWIFPVKICKVFSAWANMGIQMYKSQVLQGGHTFWKPIYTLSHDWRGSFSPKVSQTNFSQVVNESVAIWIFLQEFLHLLLLYQKSCEQYKQKLMKNKEFYCIPILRANV